MGLSRARTKDLFNGDRRMSQLIDALWRDPIGDIHPPLTLAEDCPAVLQLNVESQVLNIDFSLLDLHDPLAIDPESSSALYLDEENQIIGFDESLLSMSFLGLTDTPDSYIADADQYQSAERMVCINSSKNALTFANSIGANHNISWLRDSCGWTDLAGVTGDELLNNNTFDNDLTGWNSAGWSYLLDGSDGVAAHIVGQVTPLSQSFNVAAGDLIAVTVQVANYVAGSFQLSIDGCDEVYNTAISGTFFFNASTSGINGLSILPTSNFNGGLTLVSSKKVNDVRAANQYSYSMTNNLRSWELRFYDTNLYIGRNSGGYTQNGAENNLTLSPYGALNITTGSNNLIIGNSAGNTLKSGSNNVLISADAPAYNTSNYLNIANVYSADLSSLNSTILGGLTIYNGASGNSYSLPGVRPSADGMVLTGNTDGSTLWASVSGGGGTVTSIAAGDGMDFATITGSGSVVLGTPSAIGATSSNSVTATSHTHAISSDSATSGQVLTANGTGGVYWADGGGSSGGGSMEYDVYTSTSSTYCTTSGSLIDWDSHRGNNTISDWYPGYDQFIKILVTGTYLIKWRVGLYTSSAYNAKVQLKRGSSYVLSNYVTVDNKGTIENSYIDSFTAGEYIGINVRMDSGSANVYYYDKATELMIISLDSGGGSSSGGSGTVASVAAGNGMDFTTITTGGNVVLGTPSAISATSTNSVTATSHTHAIISGSATSGQVLTANGSGGVLWSTVSGGSSGTVTSIAAGDGMDFSTITGSGNVVLGTPSAISATSTSSVTATSHTHAIISGSATSGQVLTANGSGGVLWSTVSGGSSGTVTSIAAGDGMDFTTITTGGNVVLGTPSAISATSTNSVTATSHTHAISSGSATSGQVLTANGAGGVSWSTVSGGGGYWVLGDYGIHYTGNVGVGGEADQYNALSVGGSLDVNGALSVDSNSYLNNVKMMGSVGDSILLEISRSAGYSATNSAISFKTGLTEIWSITHENTNNNDSFSIKNRGVEALRIDDSTRSIVINNAYSLPLDKGNNGQVLTSDGSGSTSWTTIGAGSSLWTLGDYGIHYSGNVGIGVNASDLYALYVDGGDVWLDDRCIVGGVLKVNNNSHLFGSVLMYSGLQVSGGAGFEKNVSIIGYTSDTDDYMLSVSNTAGHGIEVSVPDGKYGLYTNGHIFADKNIVADGVIIAQSFRQSLITPPSSSSAIGTMGSIVFASDYIYYCIADNTWKRAALTTW